MSNNTEQLANGSRKSWKSFWRKEKSRKGPEATMSSPKPEQRQNSERWPRDEEEGIFCDSIFTALWTRGHLHSGNPSARHSQHQNGARAAEHLPAYSSTDRGVVEEIIERPGRLNHVTPHEEPMNGRVYGLVKSVLAKWRSKNSDSLHHESSNSRSSGTRESPPGNS